MVLSIVTAACSPGGEATTTTDDSTTTALDGGEGELLPSAGRCMEKDAEMILIGESEATEDFDTRIFPEELGAEVQDRLITNSIGQEFRVHIEVAGEGGSASLDAFLTDARMCITAVQNESVLDEEATTDEAADDQDATDDAVDPDWKAIEDAGTYSRADLEAWIASPGRPDDPNLPTASIRAITVAYIDEEDLVDSYALEITVDASIPAGGLDWFPQSPKSYAWAVVTGIGGGVLVAILAEPEYCFDDYRYVTAGQTSPRLSRRDCSGSNRSLMVLGLLDGNSYRHEGTWRDLTPLRYRP
jgi:hypothetical protein